MINRILFLISISPLLAVSSASAQNRWEDILPQVKVKCADQWTGDYQMQAYCIRQQRKGWEELNGDTLPTTPASPSVPTGITSPRNVGGVDDLIRIVTKYVQLYKSAPNNMVKGGLRPERGRELCSLFKGTQVKNWRGIVHSLGSNGDGNGVIEIDLGGSVSVKTMNNDFSDREYQTLIPHGSQLFKDAANLRTGQVVEFSGSLFPDPIDCFREVSLTVDGAMGEPEFLIRLSSVKHEDDAVVTPVQRREPQATERDPVSITAPDRRLLGRQK